MNEEEAREMYKELKKYKEIIGNIEPNFNTNLENWTITINLDYYNCLEEYIRRILDELEQKDKIIDEMAKKLSKFDYSQYCEVTNCNYPPCNKKKCIKQYFERKVENGN